MIVRLIIIAVSLATGFSVSMACTDGRDHDGILPKNSLKVMSTYFRPGQTMTEETFNKVIDGVQKVYSPIIEAKGAKLQVVKAWDDATVNAYATRDGNTWKVNMFGGLARHPATTEDGLALVICHELGHHIAGFPKKKSMWGGVSWAADEGQSDYFATSKCLRRYFEAAKNSAQVVASLNVTVPAAVQEKCFASWGQSKDHALCVRISLAGQSMGNLFAALGKTSEPDFAKPDATKVATTNHNHPAAQCRLDTYFNGALCTVPLTVDFSETEEKTGACVGYDKAGARPQCWFKPAEGFTDIEATLASR